MVSESREALDINMRASGEEALDIFEKTALEDLNAYFKGNPRRFARALKILHPILWWRDRLAIGRGPHTNVSTRRITRAPAFPTRNPDHPPAPEVPMLDGHSRWPIDPILASLEGQLGGDLREVVILRIDGIPGQEVPEDLVGTGSPMLRGLSQEDHFDLRLLIEFEDLEDGHP